jgi:hypothetical protein
VGVGDIHVRVTQDLTTNLESIFPTRQSGLILSLFGFGQTLGIPTIANGNALGFKGRC